MNNYRNLSGILNENENTALYVIRLMGLLYRVTLNVFNVSFMPGEIYFAQCINQIFNGRINGIAYLCNDPIVSKQKYEPLY